MSDFNQLCIKINGFGKVFQFKCKLYYVAFPFLLCHYTALPSNLRIVTRFPLLYIRGKPESNMDKYLKLILLACFYSFFCVVLYTSYSNRDRFYRTIRSSFGFDRPESNLNRLSNLLNNSINGLRDSAIYKAEGNISSIAVGTANVIRKEQNAHTDEGRKKSVDEVEKERQAAQNSMCKPTVPRLSRKPLPVTGLVSFPGAGNTWTRHLLQQVSG